MLHVASFAGHLEVVQFLASQCEGVDLNVPDMVSIIIPHEGNANRCYSCRLATPHYMLRALRGN